MAPCDDCKLYPLCRCGFSAAKGTLMQEQQPSPLSGLVGNVDASTVIHAAIIAVIAIVLYHLLFNR